MYSGHATPTIDRLDAAWHKRHICGRAATIAIDFRVLARLVESLVASPVAASLAMLGLVGEMFVVKPRLLARIPQKFSAAVFADQPLV